MTIEIRQLRYAVATADAQSFSRAATTLRVKQSTLSRRVLLMEEQLGVKLFDRSTRGAEPTEAGKKVLESARRIVTDVDNLIVTAREMTYGQLGKVSIGFSSPLTGGNLHAVISEYLNRFPEAQFDGVEAEPERLFNALQLRTLDAAIVPADISDKGIKRASLWSERVMIILKDDHPLAEAEPIYWTDLKREVFVVPREGNGAILGNLLAARLTDQRLRPNIIIQDTSHDTIVNAVRMGRFNAIATDAMLGVPWPGVVFREVHDVSSKAHLDFSIFWREDNENPALKHFFKLIKERHPSFELG